MGGPIFSAHTFIGLHIPYLKFRACVMGLEFMNDWELELCRDVEVYFGTDIQTAFSSIADYEVVYHSDNEDGAFDCVYICIYVGAAHRKHRRLPLPREPDEPVVCPNSLEQLIEARDKMESALNKNGYDKLWKIGQFGTFTVLDVTY